MSDELIGCKFNWWTVLSFSRKVGNCVYYNCECSCGKIQEENITYIKNGKKRSCGCRKSPDITGNRYGMLTVIQRNGMIGKNSSWLCRCDCGKTKICQRGSLISGGNKSCGCLSSNELTGKQFGDLKVIDFSHTDGKNRWWNCECACGKKLKCKSKNLTGGCVKNCGTHAPKSNKESLCWKGYGDISAKLWWQIKRDAGRRNLEFSVTIEEAWAIFKNQDGRCFFTGESISFSKSTREEDGGFRTASFDRIDNSLGYTINNVCWVHKEVNLIKCDMSVKDLFYWCELVVNKYKENYELIIDDTDNHFNFKGHKLISMIHWGHIISGARSRNLEFTITIEYAWDLFMQQNGQCAITKIPINLIKSKFLDKTPETASLDRIDSSKGYIEGNVQWVHKNINRLKWDLKESRFFDICKKITDSSNTVKDIMKERYNISL